MTAMQLLKTLRHELGTLGIVSIAVLTAAILFLFAVVKPLEARNYSLEQQVKSATEQTPANPESAPPLTPAAKVASFHDFLTTGKQPTEWLGHLHAAADSAGIEMRSAEYWMQSTGTRIERYEIRIPLRARYAQIRAFVDAALTRIPTLSLDEIKFKRERTADDMVNADLRLTLHLVNP